MGGAKGSNTRVCRVTLFLLLIVFVMNIAIVKMMLFSRVLGLVYFVGAVVSSG